ncbi:MAG TPA: hypothetical protein VLN74_14030, partial [Ilumatobacteraceae bacterium]|nr:hypothetical protein [Ilumatobacteraceae bacterium]
EVPAHLRDAHYQGASTIGHGAGYEYPHDHASGRVAQQYLPDALVDRHWYEPSDHGDEAALGDRMRGDRVKGDRVKGDRMDQHRSTTEDVT